MKVKDQSYYEKLIGKNYVFNTVSLYYLGKVVNVYVNKKDVIIELDEALWIADTGRLTEYINSGQASEQEVMAKVFINADSIVSFYPYRFDIELVQR